MVWVSGPLSAQSAWRVSSQEAPVTLVGGAVLLKRGVSGPVEAQVNLIVFSAAKYDLRVVTQPDRAGAVSLASKMKALGAVAGCNGGYFTPEFQPLGLEVGDGVRTGTWGRGPLLGGVLVVRQGRVSLLWRDEYAEQKGVTQLLQAGPRLVHAGQAIQGLEPTKRRARTFVLTDQAGKWAIGTCKSVSLQELATLLATPGLFPEMPVKRALNLDGGSSTALWWRTSGGEARGESEFGRVRNFLMLTPRTSPMKGSS
ncbi:phosphodiester glycosidase family protein [Verrucomicrobium sp. BvORR106]|uniref:phosphodiester glycosidase family protein n=1 Tax=Verrucomicrobium sp. BvORR106 TaxID=1403819 RepID=UPI00068CF3E0|nr:phosphodiester glycosidase family protein [Verrucomicrobium sp. BvORR106]